MKEYKPYEDKEIIKIVLKYNQEILDTARIIYNCLPYSYMETILKIIEYVTNPKTTSIVEADTKALNDTETYYKYEFLKDLLICSNVVKDMLSKAIDCENEKTFTIKRVKKLRTIKKKKGLNNINFYSKIYGEKEKTYEELKEKYRDSGIKDSLKEEFLEYIEFNDINKRKQSKKYTVSRDLDKDTYYITTEGKLAKIKGYLYRKYRKKCMIDMNRRAHTVIPEEIIIKPMKLINKTIPKANEGMKLLLASLFEGIKECHMVIDRKFNVAYSPYYSSHQDTDGDKASNYSCMSGEGERAQEFYGKIHGCKVVRWETDDGEQVGRCLMYEWKGRRHFIRIYGRYEYHRTMINMLEAQMKEEDIFGRNKEITDIKLKTDMSWDTEVMYLDGNYYGLRNEGDEWYMVAGNYDTDCKTTSGDSLESLIEDTNTCERCGRRVNNDDGIWIDDYLYCDSDCAEEDGWRCCERCGEWERENEAIYVEGVGYYCCASCANRAGYEYDNYHEEWVEQEDLGDTDDGNYYTTKEGAADYYGVDEDEVEWDGDNSCWKRPEQEQKQEQEPETKGE